MRKYVFLKISDGDKEFELLEYESLTGFIKDNIRCMKKIPYYKDIQKYEIYLDFDSTNLRDGVLSASDKQKGSGGVVVISRLDADLDLILQRYSQQVGFDLLDDIRRKIILERRKINLEELI